MAVQIRAVGMDISQTLQHISTKLMQQMIYYVVATPYCLLRIHFQEPPIHGQGL